MKLKNEEIIEKCFYKIPDDERIYRAMEYLTSREFEKLKIQEKEILLKKVCELKNYFARFYKKFGSHYNMFKNKCGFFLQSDFDFDFKLETNRKVKKRASKKKFSELCARSKFNFVKNVAEFGDFNSEILLRSALVAAKREKKLTRALKISNILKPKKIKPIKVKIS